MPTSTWLWKLLTVTDLDRRTQSLVGDGLVVWHLARSKTQEDIDLVVWHCDCREQQQKSHVVWQGHKRESESEGVFQICVLCCQLIQLKSRSFATCYGWASRREVNTGNEWRPWLTNVPLNNVFLTGPLGPRLMDGLTEARSISRVDFPSVSAADSTTTEFTSVTRRVCN